MEERMYRGRRRKEVRLHREGGREKEEGKEGHRDAGTREGEKEGKL